MKDHIIFRLIGKDSYYNIWHTSAVNMILYVHSGEGSIVTGEKNYPLVAGTLCFVGGNKLHYTLPDDPEKYERSKINISAASLEKLCELLPDKIKDSGMFSHNSVTWAMLPAEDRGTAEKIFGELNEAAEDPDCGETILLAGYLRLLIMIYKNSKAEITHSVGIIQQAVEYINRNISRNISVDEICAAVHISKYHFCRQFKKTTGHTIMEYILKTRLIMARDLLKNTPHSVEQISGLCGFGSIAYFCRVFKEDMGKTPLQYRKGK